MRFNNISMNVWLSSTCELQTDLIILKEDTSTAKPRAKPLLKILPMENFLRKNFS